MSTHTVEPGVQRLGNRGGESALGRPDLSVLQDRLPDWLKAPRVLAAFALVLGGLFLVLSYRAVWHADILVLGYRPLWHTDVWGHLAYGRWMWEHRALPGTEPLMPLCAGVPFVDTAWLSQLLGYAMHAAFGVAGVQFLYAAPITLACALLAAAIYRRTGSVWTTLLALAAFGWVSHDPLLIVRPQLAGLACFTALFALLASGSWRRWYWGVVPALFVLWANLHGSFLVGLTLLGALCAGRVLDIAWKMRRPGAVLADTMTRRLFLLLELAAAAVLVNPYGIRLYAEVLSFSRNPNLADLVEWDPLTLTMPHGLAAAVVALGLVIAYRLSPRRVRAGELLLLVAFGAAALWHSRMILWWAVIAAYYLGLHLSAAWRRFHRAPVRPSPRSGRWSVVTAGLFWICFGFTPFGVRLLHGKPTDPERAARQLAASVSRQTPVDAVDFLRRNPPQGLVFNTYEWGDYLLWDGPPGLQVFVASHAHLVPPDVWRDYMQIAYAGEGWRTGLDRYGVNTVILDHQGRKALIRLLNEDKTWTLAYDDAIAAIFTRKPTAADAPDASEPAPESHLPPTSSEPRG
jgi:hypothetical protein